MAGRGERPALVAGHGWQRRGAAYGQTAQAGGATPSFEAKDCDWLYWVAGREPPALLWGRISWSCLSAIRAKQLGVL